LVFVIEVDLPFINPIEVTHLLGAPATNFWRLASWITAYVTFERFLCIIKPLHVKRIITLFLTNLAPLVPFYRINVFVWKPINNGSRRILGIGFSAYRDDIEQGIRMSQDVISPNACFVVVSLFTTGLVYKLHQKARWRQR